MRIISMLAALPMLWMMIIPQHALAIDLVNTGEIKTNFKLEENIKIINGIVGGTNLLAKAPYATSEYVPVKSEKELKREKILAKWKTKQIAKWENLPQEQFIINASAYTAAADECGWNTGITASGLMVEENHTIACPPEYPFGAKIEIEGYGIFACEDRGGAIKGNHFDIYMETKSEAFAFGRRNLIAQVIN